MVGVEGLPAILRKDWEMKELMIVVFTLMIAVAAPANAGGLQFRNFEARGDQNVWTYWVACPGEVSQMTIVLGIPRSAYVKPVFSKGKNPVKRQEKETFTTIRDTVRQEKVSDTKTDYSHKHETVTTRDLSDDSGAPTEARYSMQQIRKEWGKLEVEFTELSEYQTITFEVIAPKRETKNGEMKWTICPNPAAGKPCSSTAPGPVDVGDPKIRYVFAGGFRLRGNSGADSCSISNELVIRDSSRKQQSFSTGLALNFWNCNNTMAADLLLSFEFGIDGSTAIDGFIGGLTLRWPQFGRFRPPEIFLGWSLRTVQTLRVAIPTATNGTPSDGPGNVDCKDPDVAQICIPGREKPICLRTRVIDKTTGAFVAGIVFPVDIGSLIPDWIKTRLGG